MGGSQRPQVDAGGTLRERGRGAEETRQDRSALTFDLTPAARSDLERYLDELRGWGARMNLVGSTDPGALEIHVADSLAAVPFLPRRARVVDLGTGAGFPGIPISIARPDLEMVLVERREKRIHFLRHVVRLLALDLSIWRTGIEQPPGSTDVFDFALLRAVAPAGRAAEMGARWVKPAGEVWVWTREPAVGGFPERGSIPLGDRGRIARVGPALVSRGTD